MSLPVNFNAQHYKALHYYEIGDKATTDKGMTTHYLHHGQKLDWAYNFGQLRVLIYSGGKTGSSTLWESFKLAVEHKHQAFHLHNDDWLGIGLGGSFRAVDVIKVPRPMKLLLVSSYREPISRHISSFFQNLETHLGLSIGEILKLDVKVLITKFFSILNRCQFESYHPHLENNQKNFDGINVFSKPFNRSLGFQTWETPQVKILLLRFDKIKDWESIIRKHTSYSQFKLVASNLTSGKSTYDLYRKFGQQIIFPKAVLDAMFAKDKLNLEYFYDWDELFQLKHQWYSRCQLSLSQIRYGLSVEKSVDVTAQVLRYLALQPFGLGTLGVNLDINELVGGDPYAGQQKKFMVWVGATALLPFKVIEERHGHLSISFSNYA